MLHVNSKNVNLHCDSQIVYKIPWDYDSHSKTPEKKEYPSFCPVNCPIPVFSENRLLSQTKRTSGGDKSERNQSPELSSLNRALKRWRRAAGAVQRAFFLFHFLAIPYYRVGFVRFAPDIYRDA
jgi:hypothetical protein